MKHKISIALTLVGLISIASIQTAQAWGMTGHRVIAEIAERHLTKKAKKHIKGIIGKQKIAYWSNWADFIKSDPDPKLNQTGSWHFVNTNADLTFQQFSYELLQSSDNNLYKAYLRIKERAKSSRDISLLEKQHDLYYIIHLFADAHQPMHVSREADLGGNKVEVTFFGRKTNIHRVWDSDLVENEKYSFTEYADVLDIHNSQFYIKYRDCTFEEMLFQSHELANKIYKDAADNANLSYKYIYDYKYVMEECLLKAGIRLAMELNEIYG
ncbi:S1/P1 Nuclease [Sphingobacterium alkalisoli]|uniref:S1/P1 Nuclease n=1 Tax=Sphingobacterium alkalisoli TaxID=1874115 RepID=A0A4U0H218_9SPHI|nr:S1/P1 nuclease [Sphingobacterium alkalisoli]TJY65657.1 S1/P1 Nuclease [Sphingobacterium alkalisoli]GGH19163.1 endonuclease [Sphingobacterium alkalisoli]